MATKKTHKAGSISNVSNSSPLPFRKISPSDLKGPKPTPRRIVIDDFFGPGESGTLYFLPMPLNLSWKIKSIENVDPAEMGHTLAEQLSKSIVNEDGSPLMSVDDWGEMTFERLIDVSSQIMKAASEEDSEGKNG